ncbi:MAG: transcriptional regulator [Sphingomonadales bacterium 63-6]|nr:MAG: transcriptional regulator [Sphingomonadales bacterium 63-6]
MKTPIPLDLLRANAENMAGRLRILSHPDRLLMLCRMSDEEVTVGELVELTGMSQSAVSQHLAKFRDMGLVSVRPDAQTRYYRLVDDDVRQIILALWEICQAGMEGTPESCATG